MTGDRETAAYARLLGQFAERMTDSELIEAALLPARPIHPRAPRKRTLIGASLLRDTMPEQRLIVRNVSPRGMCLAARGHALKTMPLPDQIVCIRLPDNVEHIARVRWVDDHLFGVELFRPLDIEALGAANRRRNHRFLQMLEPARPPSVISALGDIRPQ